MIAVLEESTAIRAASSSEMAIMDQSGDTQKRGGTRPCIRQMSSHPDRLCGSPLPGSGMPLIGEIVMCPWVCRCGVCVV